MKKIALFFLFALFSAVSFSKLITLNLTDIITLAKNSSNISKINSITFKEYELTTIPIRYPYVLNSFFKFEPSLNSSEYTQYTGGVNFGYKDYLGTFTYVYSPDNNNYTNTTAIQFGKSVQDFLYGSYNLAQDIEPLQTRINTIDSTLRLNKTISSAINYYFSMLEAKQQIDINEKIHQIQIQDKKALEIRLIGGLASKYDLEELSIAKMALNNQLLHSKRIYDMNLEQLKRILNIPLHDTIVLDRHISSLSLEPKEIQDKLNQAIALNLEKSALEKKIQALQSRYDSIHNADFPTISTGVGYNWSNGWNVYASVSYNALPWNSNSKRIALEKEKNALINTTEENYFFMAKSQLENALNLSFNDLSTALSTRRLAKRFFDNEEILFNNKLLSYTNYLIAQKKWIEAENQYIVALYAHYRLLYQLDYPNIGVNSTFSDNNFY